MDAPFSQILLFPASNTERSSTNSLRGRGAGSRGRGTSAEGDRHVSFGTNSSGVGGGGVEVVQFSVEEFYTPTTLRAARREFGGALQAAFSASSAANTSRCAPHSLLFPTSASRVSQPAGSVQSVGTDSSCTSSPFPSNWSGGSQSTYSSNRLPDVHFTEPSRPCTGSRMGVRDLHLSDANASCVGAL
mmetsp:Transcript_61562/g.129936  ORF Transcript_61562/g.129936 Transcript_61562/m.129936 type:complete len:188 (+) Transcript_61562:73-636(+)